MSCDWSIKLCKCIVDEGCIPKNKTTSLIAHVKNMNCSYATGEWPESYYTCMLITIRIIVGWAAHVHASHGAFDCSRHCVDSYLMDGSKSDSPLFAEKRLIHGLQNKG